MAERPRPDIDHTREALREHDERVSESTRRSRTRPRAEASRSDDEADEDG